MARIFILLFLLLWVTVSVFAEEKITITTYYPSPYGVYGELKADKIVLGETTFTSVQGSYDCPEGYEIFYVRWKVKECSSDAPMPKGYNKCRTERFVWASSTVPYCRFCLEGKGDFCSKWQECVASKIGYTVCVKIP